MTEQDFAHWIREEHDQIHELADWLTEKVAIVPRANLDEWIADVRERFGGFRVHLTKHMALEERRDYLPTVVGRRPSLAPQFQQLQHEHGELLAVMEGVHQTLENLTPEAHLLVRDCCHRITSLLKSVEQHEELENQLIGFACGQDTETGNSLNHTVDTSV